jgi:hypothetical protein
VTVTPYEETHLPGILAICEAENWPSLPADPARAHAVFTAPGVTTVVAQASAEHSSSTPLPSPAPNA